MGSCDDVDIMSSCDCEPAQTTPLTERLNGVYMYIQYQCIKCLKVVVTEIDKRKKVRDLSDGIEMLRMWIQH